MHELSIATDICTTVAEHAAGRRVASIEVEVGALAGVAVESLEFCMGEVARELKLGEPKIIIRLTPARVKCACGNEYDTDDLLVPCPSCGGYRREVVHGMDIFIREVTLED